MLGLSTVPSLLSGLQGHYLGSLRQIRSILGDAGEAEQSRVSGQTEAGLLGSGTLHRQQQVDLTASLRLSMVW
jgi:hypothetical protein